MMIAVTEQPVSSQEGTSLADPGLQDYGYGELDDLECLPVTGDEFLWSRAIARETGIRVASCYQCLRCTNSCPVSRFMDIKPHQVVRFVQFGQRDRLLACSSIWICLSCEMCTTYCPNEIAVAELMAHLKNAVVSSRRVPAETEIALFHKVFLEALERHGRINDLQLMQRYRLELLKRGHLPSYREVLEDARMAYALFRRGRLRLRPERSGAVKELRGVK